MRFYFWCYNALFSSHSSHHLFRNELNFSFGASFVHFLSHNIFNSVPFCFLIKTLWLPHLLIKKNNMAVVTGCLASFKSEKRFTRVCCRHSITRPNCALDRSTMLCLYVPEFQRQVLKYVPKCNWIPQTKFQWIPHTYTCNVNFVGIFFLLRIPQQATIASCSGFRNCKWIPQNVSGIRK